ncbi:MAG: hypothetical protein LBS51_00015 [Oscillospiraceae bacterium]|jgi:hypothetical protein|nr:hypothetical protein [Oscillospiraceae bacterium]
MIAGKAEKSRAAQFVMRYIWRRARRAVAKSALALLLAALLLIAVAQFALMRESYVKLRDDTVVTANFTEGLPLSYLTPIIKSGYVKNPFYGGDAEADINYDYADVLVTNDISRYAGVEAEITYAPGYDETCMDAFGEILILGETFAEKHQLEPGDTVDVVPTVYQGQARAKYTQYHRTKYPDDDLTYDKLMVLYGDKIREEAAPMAVPYTVVGVLSTSSVLLGISAFTPGVIEDVKSFGLPVELDVAEFTLADNLRADEFREYGSMVADRNGGVRFIMDTGKLDNLVSTSNLLAALYPIAAAAALLIGGFLCALVIFQSSKDAAIMRVQGTTKRKTRAILAIEQIFLGIAGLALGACALLAYNGSGLTPASGSAALFAAMYFAMIAVSGAVSSAAATHKNVLELLQTKE